jgi:hypothetical protein
MNPTTAYLIARRLENVQRNVNWQTAKRHWTDLEESDMVLHLPLRPSEAVLLSELLGWIRATQEATQERRERRGENGHDATRSVHPRQSERLDGASSPDHSTGR